MSGHDDLPPPPARTASGAPAAGWWQASDGGWYPPQQTAGAAPPPPRGYVPDTNTQANTAMWLGISAILLCWTLIGGWVLGILAIVFGALSKNKAPVSGKSTGAIIMGIIAITLPIAFLVGVQLLGDSADKSFRCTSAEIDGTFDPDCN